MWDAEYYRALAEKLKEATALVADALADAGQPERVEMIYELIEANELGIALEDLCENLFEFSCSLPPKAYDLIEQAGKTMGINGNRWRMLKSQISN